LEEGDLKPENVKKIATKLGVTEAEVVMMNRRLSGGDASLNAPIRNEGEGTGEWQDWLVDDEMDQETSYARDQELEQRRELLAAGMKSLNEREQKILTERRLQDEPKTLEELAQVYEVSRERIRQIEVRAFEKLQKAMKRAAREQNLLPPKKS